MNKKLKKQWINALKSGQYKQGRGSLKTKYGNYCCLGVLADIVDKKNWKEPVDGNHSWEHDGSKGSLSYSVLEKTELSEGEMSILMKRNDDSKWDFNRIAEYIEREL